MMQYLLSDDTGERARRAVGGGNSPLRLLPLLTIDGSERGPRLSYFTEIALDPISVQAENLEGPEWPIFF